MDPLEFRAALKDARLSQRDLARLAGVSATAVNRWCSLGAADRLPPPPEVAALVIAFEMLTERQRQRLLAAVEQAPLPRGVGGAVLAYAMLDEAQRKRLMGRLRESYAPS